VFALHGCGDGTIDAGEQCDDGNVTSGDGCSATCVLEPCGGSPKPLCRVALHAQMQLSEKAPGRERLKVQWKKIYGSTTLASFGDPVSGSTSARLCLYGDAGALIRGYEVDRAGQQCAGKPCWALKGTTGYGYEDDTAASDGITAIAYKTGPSRKGKASAAGANKAAKGQTALPTGVVAALTGNSQPTMQLLTSDGLCLGATMTVTRNEGGRYKAKK
jgi:cysteine-rich repeat protein